MSRTCRHCREGPASRPRGLCWKCYYASGVRERYGSESKFGHRGLGNGYYLAPLPPYPTQALPGTPEKVAILAQRALLRQALWHPNDATFHAATELSLVS